MKSLPIVFAACLAAGCATGPVVQTDRDPTVDLARYRSYAWRQEPPIGSPLLRQRVVTAVDAELARKGWQRVPEADADVILVGNVASREDARINYFYEGSGWEGWNWYGRRDFGAQRVELQTYRIGTLVLDMLDTSTRRAVWRGVAEGMVPDSEAHRTRDALQAVERMFRQFPQSDAASP